MHRQGEVWPGYAQRVVLLNKENLAARVDDLLLQSRALALVHALQIRAQTRDHADREN